MRVRYGCGLATPVEHHARARRCSAGGCARHRNGAAQRDGDSELFAVFGVPGRVHHLAMSNYSGVASTAPRPPGLEPAGKDVDRCVPRRCRARRSTRSRRRTSAGRRIDLLSVDVEGQDALVLEGAEQFAARAVGVVEFEHCRGYWRADKDAERRLLRQCSRASRGLATAATGRATTAASRAQAPTGATPSPSGCAPTSCARTAPTCGASSNGCRRLSERDRRCEPERDRLVLALSYTRSSRPLLHVVVHM